MDRFRRKPLWAVMLASAVMVTGCFDDDDDDGGSSTPSQPGAAEALSHTEYLAESKRVKGTAAELEAAQYIADQLTEAGYQPTTQSFSTATGKVLGSGPAASSTLVSVNIIAEKKSSTNPDKVVILGAHYDSVPQNEGTGYSDNASGTGVALGVAQALADRDDLPYTVRIIFFGAEESCPSSVQSCVDSGLAGTGGLKGSIAYTSTLTTDDIGNIVAMLNLDTPVGGDFLYAHGASQGDDGWVRERLLDIASELGIDFRVNPGNPIPPSKPDNPVIYPEGTTGSWSDHWPFLTKGVETGYIEATNWDIDYGDGYTQSKEIFDAWEACFEEVDASNPDASEDELWDLVDEICGPATIWHTDLDTLEYLEEMFPGRVTQQSDDVVAVVYEFLLDPQPPAELSAGAFARREAAICSEVIGKRVAGQAGEMEMADYLVQRMTELGYQPDIHDFTIPEYDDPTDDFDDDDWYSPGLPSQNVFAVKEGVGEGELVLGAHYDSVPQAGGTGYTDGCSQAATLLAVAREVKNDAALPFDVRFIFFGSEENGLFGSELYVDAMDGSTNGKGGQSLGDIDNVIGMLNMDTPWGGDFVYVHGRTEGEDGWMREQLLAKAEQEGYEFRPNPGNFISVGYWDWNAPDPQAVVVPADTACVTGGDYSTKAGELGEPLVRADLEADLIDFSGPGPHTVTFDDYCIYLPEGTTGAWSDHAPFQKAGKEIAYIEATNFDIENFDGYAQVAHLKPQCLDFVERYNKNPDNVEKLDPDDYCFDASEIWHTDRDNFEYMNDPDLGGFADRIRVQSEQIIDVITHFVRNVTPMGDDSSAPDFGSVLARTSEIGRHAEVDSSRAARFVRLKALLEELEDKNTSVQLLREALTAEDLTKTALFRRLTPEALEKLRELRRKLEERDIVQ